MSYLNHNLPDWNCFIRNEFLFNHEKGQGEVTACDVHSVASIEKRVPLFEVFLDNGVNWTRRPLHALCWNKDAPIEPLEQIVYWDCFSPYIDVQKRARLANLRAELLRPDGKRVHGTYMFTLDWSWENKNILDCNFSETPEHKCAHLFKVETGNYYAYPNNRVIWYDDAFMTTRIAGNPGYIIDTTIYTVENNRGIKTNDEYFYGKDKLEEVKFNANDEQS